MYKTNSLDIAGYLVANGYECELKRLGPRYCEFKFNETDECTKLAKKFLKGEAVMSIQKFMYSRTHLKNMSGQEMIHEINKPARPFAIRIGDKYFSIVDKKIQQFTFDDKIGDNARIKTNNCYLTIKEARVFLK